MAPVAQLDRALASGAKGREFESRRARSYHELNTLKLIIEHTELRRLLAD